MAPAMTQALRICHLTCKLPDENHPKLGLGLSVKNNMGTFKLQRTKLSSGVASDVPSTTLP